MNLQAVYGLVAQGVIVAALIRFVRVLSGKARAKPHGGELWLPVMILLAGSADGISLAAHVRGVLGDPSVVTLLVLFLFTLQPSWLPPVPRPGVCLALVALVAADRDGAPQAGSQAGAAPEPGQAELPGLRRREGRQHRRHAAGLLLRLRGQTGTRPARAEALTLVARGSRQ